MEKKEIKKAVENKTLSLKELLTQAKERKTARKGFGHVGFAKKTLRKIKEEVGAEEFTGLGPGAVFYVTCQLMKQKDPNLWKVVEEKVGLKRYRNEVSVQYYNVRDEK